ncbi:MAG: hypothetical protein KKH72_12770 [Alphaproteobacteria bacterium]|nr:hypothetical protein [Alphaproteobacteria bacterium]
MSFLKKLFGGGDGGAQGGGGGDKVLGTQEHKGFVIRAVEMRAGAEYQLCGEVEKDIDGELKVHRFIRADRLASPDLAKEAALNKGVQIVDEQGDRLFS